MRFLIKSIAIYLSKKTEFNNKNNYEISKFAYFWLINYYFYFTF